MNGFPALLRQVIAGGDLSSGEAAEAVGAIVDQTISPIQSAALLAALAAKGESVDEVIGAARAMRERSLRVEHGLPLVLDVVGTGGDGAQTLNISTGAALIAAGAGVPVAKHGNRAASSACGSADVLEALGVRIDLEPGEAAELLRSHRIAFLFAQRYHPAMKAVAGVRKDLGVPTIFNLLGPLINPAGAQRVMVGVARPRYLEIIPAVLQTLGVEAGAVFHAASGLDEIAGEGPTEVIQFSGTESWRWTLNPSDFGVHCDLPGLRGGDSQVNAAALLAILSGERSGRADVMILNGALALVVAGAADNLGAGMALARQSVETGAALAALNALRSAGQQPTARG